MMKNKQIYYMRASFAFLLFVILGYTVRFYPDSVSNFDWSIQTALRGDFPQLATIFFKSMTMLGNTVIILAVTLVTSAIFYKKQWKAEIGLMLASFLGMAIFSTAFKSIYHRPRPTIEWLMTTIGYSFPSWHAGSTAIIYGALIIIIAQRMSKSAWKLVLQMTLGVLALFVALSRIYIGVHYPTDIIGGWLLAYGLLNLIFPFYDNYRFQWRFQGKQK